MKQRYRMFQRGQVFYAEDTTTGKQTSLKTKDDIEACRLLAAKNEVHAATFGCEFRDRWPIDRHEQFAN
jgi:hypothetical protein